MIAALAVGRLLLWRWFAAVSVLRHQYGQYKRASIGRNARRVALPRIAEDIHRAQSCNVYPAADMATHFDVFQAYGNTESQSSVPRWLCRTTSGTATRIIFLSRVGFRLLPDRHQHEFRGHAGYTPVLSGIAKCLVYPRTRLQPPTDQARFAVALYHLHRTAIENPLLLNLATHALNVMVYTGLSAIAAIFVPVVPPRLHPVFCRAEAGLT